MTPIFISASPLGSSPVSGSFQGLRSRWGMSGWEQASISSGLSVRENGSTGTRVMWLLSQMIRDRETVLSCSFWLLLKTPFLSHQNLFQTNTFTLNFFHQCYYGLCLVVVVPVPVPEGSELSSQEAGKEWSDSTSGQGRLRYGAHPHVDVVWGPI